jgi:hypothetical protein
MGRTAVSLVAVAWALAGCSGVDIRPISPALEAASHARDGAASGYVVYGPMVVVEVGLREVCVARNEKGACTEQEARCAAGAPFVLPDLAKPFLVDIRNGFGKAGVDLAIADGWRLGALKADVDNTAILGTVEKLIPLLRSADGTTRRKGDCAAAGLYRVALEGGSVKLLPLFAY